MYLCRLYLKLKYKSKISLETPRNKMNTKIKESESRGERRKINKIVKQPYRPKNRNDKITKKKRDDK